MQKIIDTHAHIYMEEFSEDIQEILERAEGAGIEKIYMPNVDTTTIDRMLDLEQKNQMCVPMMGLHPCSVNKSFEKDLYTIEQWLDNRNWSAIGEIGTDLYWEKTFWEQQKEAFIVQCEWAIKHQIPVVIHCRESLDQTIQMVEDINSNELKGIFHCFNGNLNQANRIINLGFKIGIGGVITYKNTGLDKLFPSLDLKHIVLETDSPYLSPTPFRGKRNEPSYLNKIIEKVANFSKKTDNMVRISTYQSSKSIFN